MGATLVAKVVNFWGSRLGDSAFRVLVAMALTAKDNGTPEAPAGMYFGGHDGLMTGIRHDADANPESLRRTVRRAVNDLIAIGAIECTVPAVSGGNAVYRLTLNNTPRIYKRENKSLKKFKEEEDTTCPAEEDTWCPPGQDTTCPTGEDTTCPAPYKEEEPLEEPLEELIEEEGVNERGPVAVRARDTADTPNSECSDPKCRMGYIPNPARQSPKDSRNIRCPTCHPPGNVLQFGRRTA